jgi:hypothetical protein
MSLDNSSLYTEVKEAINKHSAENKSNTPDYILAEYLMDCLTAFENAIEQRDKWHNFIPKH